jgi:hypothetical protein
MLCGISCELAGFLLFCSRGGGVEVTVLITSKNSTSGLISCCYFKTDTVVHPTTNLLKKLSKQAYNKNTKKREKSACGFVQRKAFVKKTKQVGKILV